jgi:hypothetical protein
MAILPAPQAITFSNYQIGTWAIIGNAREQGRARNGCREHCAKAVVEAGKWSGCRRSGSFDRSQIHSGESRRKALRKRANPRWEDAFVCLNAIASTKKPLSFTVSALFWPKSRLQPRTLGCREDVDLREI